LVLTGPQGFGKSSLFREWASIPDVGELFSDTRFNMKDKDAYLQLYMAWIYEDAEMSGHSSADKEVRKGFLSSQVDRIRPPFGRKVRTFKRHTVIVATSNERNILRDSTGDRRYWVVQVPKTGQADLEWLRRHKGQLFAEAVHRFKAGEPWWLTREEEALRSKNNEAFRYVDWYTECAGIVYRANQGGPRNRFTVSQFARAIDDHINPQARGLSLSAALLRVGFERTRSNGTTWYEKMGTCTGNNNGLNAIRELSTNNTPHVYEAYTPGD
jgi:predicted P-loop ATPase